MYCPYCNSTLPENATFCSVCGKNVTYSQNYQSALQQQQEQNNAIRQSEISKLSSLMQHFSVKQAQFDAYDDICRKINHYAKGAKSALLVWGCIITTFSLIMLAALTNDSSFDTPEDFAVFFAIFLLPGILMIVGGILMKVINRKQLHRFEEEYMYLSVELYNHYVAYPNCPIGAEYTNPRVIAAMLRILQSGCCNTLQESMNLMFANTNHNALNRYLSVTQQNTASINMQTRVPVLFMPSYLFK